MVQRAAWKKAAILVAAITALSSTALTQDRSGIGADIVINQGQTARNIACVLCSVYVHGTVTGNIAVVLGKVTVDGTVNQHIAVALGDINVHSGGMVEGDTAIAMGQLHADPGSRMEGRSTSMPTGAILVMAAIPLGILALAIWFIVWLVRRARRPRYPYPPPRL